MMFSKKYNYKREMKHKCPCVQKPKYNLSAVGCADDAKAVAVLPYQWTPKPGGSILANYLKEREEKHIKTRSDLENKTQLVNKEIETKIRNLAEKLVCNIDNNQCDIDCVIRKYNSIAGPLSHEIYNEVLNNMENIISNRFHDIDEFKEQALRLERDRAEGLKKVLHDNFRSIIAAGLISPKDVLKEFDDNIYEVNQQLLSNCSAYIELETQLRAQADQSRRKARSLVNQLRLGVAVKQRGGSALYSDSDNSIVQQRSKSADIKDDSCYLVNKKKPINTKDLQIFVTTLTEEYKIAIANLYKNFFDKFNDLYKGIGDLNCIEKQMSKHGASLLDENLEEPIEHLPNINFYSVMHTNENFSELADYIKAIQKSFKSVHNELENTYLLLHEASHLWDAHMVRVALAQKLTLAAVEELVSKHDSLELDNEITFNVALEQMMTATDVVKLNQCYDILITFLQQKTDEYKQHSDAEIERLSEFINLQVPLKNTVQAEFNFFVKKYPVPTFALINQDDSSQDTRLHICGSNVKDVLSREIFLTEFQEVALKNWRNGFLEKFENRLNSLTEKLDRQLRFWVSERSLPLLERHSMKRMTHEIRKERVIAAKQLRLENLLEQETCLEAHFKAENELVNGLPTEVSEHISLDLLDFYPICQWINGIAQGIEDLTAPEVDEEVKRLKMMSYAARLTKHRALFEESLDPFFDFLKKNIENRIQIVRISNFQYISSLKLLNEGGRQSAPKAVEISTLLVNKSHALEICLNKAYDVLKERRNEIIAQVDTMIKPLQTAAEETNEKVKNKMKKESNKNKKQGNKK